MDEQTADLLYAIVVAEQAGDTRKADYLRGVLNLWRDALVDAALPKDMGDVDYAAAAAQYAAHLERIEALRP